LQDLRLDRNQKSSCKLWKSKFGNKNKLPTFINGESDELTITNLFANTYSVNPVNNVSIDISTPSPRHYLIIDTALNSNVMATTLFSEDYYVVV